MKKLPNNFFLGIQKSVLRLANPVTHEPCRQNRFVVNLPAEMGINSFEVNTAERPEGNFDGVNFSWESQRFTFLDLIGSNISETMFNRINNGNIPFNMQLNMLDPVGETVHSYEMQDVVITRVDFGTCSYVNGEFTTIDVWLRPGNCTMIF